MHSYRHTNTEECRVSAHTSLNSLNTGFFLLNLGFIIEMLRNQSEGGGHQTI